MELYYTTIRNSETGKKLTEVFNRADKCKEEIRQFVQKCGFERYKPRQYSFEGCGIYGMIDYKGWDIDELVWDRYLHTSIYYPNQSSKEGRALYEEFKLLPHIDMDEVAGIIGYDTEGWKEKDIKLKFSKNNEYNYGFIVDHKYEIAVPEDCTEITKKDYFSLYITQY